jgi:hypothetical protein
MKTFMMKYKKPIQWTLAGFNGVLALSYYTIGDTALALLWTVLTVSFLSDALDKG